MDERFIEHLRAALAGLHDDGLYKHERTLASPQDAAVAVGQGDERAEVINLCANNYLGLANHPEVREAAKDGIDRYGYGMASVRFICGTQETHVQLEERLSAFFGTEATILYPSGFDANTGFFETLLEERDAIISDALNHASVIDGIRLCKARRLRYANNDMAELESCLRQASDARFKVIVTDGVFSMDGVIADLASICDLADAHGALVMVDDAHGVGVLGEHGRGTCEYHGVEGRVDIASGTLGKALGGAMGGYATGRREIVEWLRQRSRPYLFSNALPPAVARGSLEALELIEQSDDLRRRLMDNTRYFRRELGALGFDVRPGEHPIVPVMLGDARLAGDMAARLLELGVYVIGFSYPVVPRGEARIRVQLSAAHTGAQLDQAVEAFRRAGRELGVIAA